MVPTVNGIAELDITDANEDGDRMVTYVDLEKDEEALQLDVSDTVEERRFIVATAELLRIWKNAEKDRRIASSSEKEAHVTSTVVDDGHFTGPARKVCLTAPKYSVFSPVSSVSVSPKSSLEVANASTELSMEDTKASCALSIEVANASTDSSMENSGELTESSSMEVANESTESSIAVGNASPESSIDVSTADAESSIGVPNASAESSIGVPIASAESSVETPNASQLASERDSWLHPDWICSIDERSGDAVDRDDAAKSSDVFDATKKVGDETKAEADKETPHVQGAHASSSASITEGSCESSFDDFFDMDGEYYGMWPSENWHSSDDGSASSFYVDTHASSEEDESSDEEEAEKPCYPKNVGWAIMANIGFKYRLGANEDGMDQPLKPFPRSHGRNAGIGAEKKNPKTAGLVIKESKKQDLVAAMAEISKAKKEEKVLDLWKLSDIGLVGKFLYCQMTCDLENVADENLIKFDEGQRQRAVSKCKKLVARCGSFRALRERYDYCGRFYQLCMTLFMFAPDISVEYCESFLELGATFEFSELQIENFKVQQEFVEAAKEEGVWTLWMLSDVALIAKVLYFEWFVRGQTAARDGLVKDALRREDAIANCKALAGRCGSFVDFLQRSDYVQQFFQLCDTLFHFHYVDIAAMNPGTQSVKKVEPTKFSWETR